MVLISKVPIISCLWKSFLKAPIFTSLYDVFCKYCQQPFSNSSFIDRLKQKKIEEDEQFVKARPTLMQLCKLHWQDFAQYAVKPFYIISTKKSIDPSNVIDYVYLLQKELLEKERIMGNYRYFVETYPKVREALMEYLRIKNLEIHPL